MAVLPCAAAHLDKKPGGVATIANDERGVTRTSTCAAPDRSRECPAHPGRGNSSRRRRAAAGGGGARAWPRSLPPFLLFCGCGPSLLEAFDRILELRAHGRVVLAD